MIIYITNNHTGKKYHVSPISMLLLRFCAPFSFILYGLGVALLFDLLGLQSDIIILVMVIAYVIEILLETLNKPTMVIAIFGFIVFIVLCPIWIDIFRSFLQFSTLHAQIEGIIHLYGLVPEKEIDTSELNQVEKSTSKLNQVEKSTSKSKPSRSENISFFKNPIRTLKQTVNYTTYLYNGIGRYNMDINNAIIHTKQ